MKKTVVFLCEEILHTKFFLNMMNAFNELNYNCIYIATDLGIYWYLKENNIKNLYLLKKNRKSYNNKNALIAKEFIEHELTEKNVKKIYNAIFFLLDKITYMNKIDLIMCSQGVRISEIAIKDWARNNKIKILFCELANIDGKTFFDKEGSNAKSYLYNNIQILDKYNIDEALYEKWKNQYIENNLKKHIVKQSIKEKDVLLINMLSKFGYIYTGLKVRRWNIFNKIKKIFYQKFLSINFDKIDLENKRYIFFPLQVMNDSQLVLNSNIGLIDGLLYCIKKAQYENLDLIIKLHPAENNILVLKRILELRKQYKFKIVKDTFLVIKNASKVITINSTVALEAMILNKEVEILGRSYYKYFDKQRIKNYIMGYLVNIDFFSKKQFDKEQIKNLLLKYDIIKL